MTGATIIFLCGFFANASYVRYRIGSRFSVCLLLFGALLVLHGIPLLIYLYLTGPDTLIYEEALRFVEPEETMSRFLIAMSLMFFSLVFGAELANASFSRWYRIGRERTSSYGPRSSLQVLTLSPRQETILWMVVLAMLGVSIHESHLSSAITFFQFTGTELEKTLMRSELGGSPYYLYNVMLYSVAPFLVMVSYCNDVGDKKKRWPSSLTIALFCVVLLGKFGTLSKAPPVLFILQLYLLTMILKKGKLNFNKFIMLLSFSIILFITITRLTFPELDNKETLFFLYYRIFDITNEVLLEYFSAIPATIPHTWGQSLFDFLYGGVSANSPQTYSLVAEVTRGSLISTSNAMFVGDAWAQFSWFGVCFVSVAAGFLVRTLDLYGLRNGDTDQSACIIAGCSFGIVTILSTAFTTGLITGGLATVPLISMFFVRIRTASIVPVSDSNV